MRSVSAQGGRIAINGASAIVAAGAPTGTSVVALSFAGLRGGSWSISANNYFSIDASGVVRTTSTPTVAGTTYRPTVTFNYEGGGTTLTASTALAILAMLAPSVPTVPTDPTPAPVPGTPAASLKANPFPSAPSAPLPAASDVIYIARDVGYSSMFHKVDINGDVGMFSITGAKQDTASGPDQTVDGIQISQSSKSTLRVTARIGTTAKNVLVNGEAINFPMPDMTNIKWTPRVEVTPDFVKVYAGPDGQTLVVFFDFNDTTKVYTIDGNGLLKDYVRNNIADGLHTWAASFAGNNVSNDIAGEYAPVYPPVTLNNATVLSDGTVEAVVDYYSETDQYLDIELVDAAGNTAIARQHGQIVEYPATGRVRIRSTTTVPVNMRGVPLTARFTLVGTGDTKSAGGVTWAQPMLFTINMTQAGNWYANQPLANHIALDDPRNRTYAGYGPENPVPRGPHTENPEIDFKGNLIEGAGRTQIAWHINPPAIPGQRMRYKVKGSATLKLSANGDSQVRNPIAGSGDGYTWIDYNHDWSVKNLVTGDQDLNSKKEAQFVWAEVIPTGTGATWPTEYDCRPINDDGTPISPGFWDLPYLDELKSTMGHQNYDVIRFMDMQRIVHNHGDIIARVTQPGDRCANTGVSIDDILDACEYLGIWGRYSIPTQATEANVRAEARKAAKWSKRTGKPVVIEWSNEVWNSGQGGWYAAVVLGKAMGMTTTGHDNDIALRYHSFALVQRMGWMRAEFAAEGVADKLIRVVAVQNANRGNQVTICENATGALDAWDRLETAPYIAPGAAISPTNLLVNGVWDNATYLTRARASYRDEHANAAYHRAYALSRGKSYGTYEGGQEHAGDAKFHLQFQISPEQAILTKEQLDHWETTVGGPYRWYADNRCDMYGLRVHRSQPRLTTGGVPGAPVWHAWLNKIAQVKATA